MAIKTRLLTPDDAEAYWAIRLEALEEVPRAFGASAEKHRATEPEDMVERLRPIENGSFIVGAFAGVELVGTAGLGWPETDGKRPVAFVWGVYVTPASRGQGIAARMFEALLGRAHRYEALEQISLDCFGSSVGALALYRKLGFRTTHLEPGAVRVGDEDVDLHHMLLDLRR